ncbi:MAG: hypothetical protein WAM79_22705 [Candidatus Sulfotelmatobacter sp.]
MPATTQFANELHETNERLRSWLGSLSLAGSTVRPATPEQMNGILSELMRVGQWLRAAQAETDDAVQQELGIYRKHVEQLRAVLPSIHQTLLHERARLEQERQRLSSASEWVRASRQTL